MKSRLGHYYAGGDVRGRSPSAGGICVATAGTRFPTLLHEMVHQWQDETGKPLDHGRGFRAKARAVGIEAAAKRAVVRPSASKP